MKILIVEDEPSLNKAMVDYLHHQQYLCESVNNFHDALEKTESYEYDCIVLDIMLPGGNGLELLRQLKANKKTEGVIIISARNELDDKLSGLQLGADDYLTKPFHLPELGARVDAIIRRKVFGGKTLVEIGDLSLHVQEKTASVQEKLLDLTRMEYDLLLYLTSNKNRVISKAAMAEHIWGDSMDMAGNYDFLYTHIKNLRKKLLQAGCPDYIKSVYGLGYKFSV